MTHGTIYRVYLKSKRCQKNVKTVYDGWGATGFNLNSNPLQKETSLLLQSERVHYVILSTVYNIPTSILYTIQLFTIAI